jgi:predicted peroxiredoxin
MKRVKQLLMVVVLGFTFATGSASAETKGVFIDLSSADIFKIHRAFAVGTMLRNMHKVPVTVYVSLAVTPYVDKDYPVAQMLALRGQNVHKHMTDFMEAGGKIMVCAMCLGGHGLTEADLLPGITAGMPGKLILADDVKLLSY